MYFFTLLTIFLLFFERQGECGPRVSEFDLVKLTGTGDIYVVFEATLHKITPEARHLFRTQRLDEARWVPRSVADACFPTGGDFDNNAKIRKIIQNAENGEANYFIQFSNSDTRTLSASVIAQCGFSYEDASIVSITSNDDFFQTVQVKRSGASSFNGALYTGPFQLQRAPDARTLNLAL